MRLPSWMSPLSSLPYLTGIADQVEQIVLDLERRTGEEAEPDEAIEVHVAPRADQRARAHREDGRVPAGLLQDHVQVVGLAQVDGVVSPPPELDRLSLDGFPNHLFAFDQHAHGQGEARAAPHCRAAPSTP